jgi:hypothetical protein
VGHWDLKWHTQRLYRKTVQEKGKLDIGLSWSLFCALFEQVGRMERSYPTVLFFFFAFGIGKLHQKLKLV